jgi:hypothetical protein
LIYLLVNLVYTHSSSRQPWLPWSNAGDEDEAPDGIARPGTDTENVCLEKQGNQKRKA